MVNFTNITVLPHLGVDITGGFDIYWTIAGNDFTPTFKIEQAPTESGPWTTLSTGVTDTFLLNAGSMQLNLQALAWFRISIYSGATLMLTSPAMDNRNGMIRRDYLRYREILRRKRITFDKTPTSPGYLIRRKLYGAKCQTCLDEILETPTSSQCPECYGTGITGGFYAPVQMNGEWWRGHVPRVLNQTSKEEEGPRQVQKGRLNIFAVPDAKSEDVWVDKGTQYFYLIEKVDPEQFGGSIIGQTLELSRLPAQHPAYRFLRDVINA